MFKNQMSEVGVGVLVVGKTLIIAYRTMAACKLSACWFYRAGVSWLQNMGVGGGMSGGMGSSEQG